MTDLATWAQTLASIANLVLNAGHGTVVSSGSAGDLYIESFDSPAGSDRPYTATYLHAGRVCVQYIAHHPALTDELVSA